MTSTKALAVSALANLVSAVAAGLAGEFIFSGIFLLNAIGFGVIPASD